MSLSKLVKIDLLEGATFNSHIDGKKFVLSPEGSIKIQKDLNNAKKFLDKGIKQDSDGCTVIYKYFPELESNIDFNQLLNFPKK